MRFKQRPPASWDIRTLDPNTLSDEQIAYFYAKALHEGVDTPEFPPDSAGRMAIASQYVRFCQRNLRKLTEVPKPEF